MKIEKEFRFFISLVSYFIKIRKRSYLGIEGRITRSLAFRSQLLSRETSFYGNSLGTAISIEIFYYELKSYLAEGTTLT